MAKKKLPKILSDNTRKSLLYFTFILIVIILGANIGYILFAINYNVVWIRVNETVEVPDEYEVLVIGVAVEYEDPLDPDEVWYYNLYGGAVNNLGFEENDTENEDVLRNWFQRILVDIQVQELYVFLILNKTTNPNGEYVFVGKTAELYRATEIIIKDIDVTSESLDLEVNDLNFFVEVFFNVI